MELYFDDLQIGQRLTSGTQVVDEEQIKACRSPAVLSGLAVNLNGQIQPAR
ncbi:MAG: hypothetical protein WA624_22555 [Methylocella sp.]